MLSYMTIELALLAASVVLGIVPTQSQRACSIHPDTELADDRRRRGGGILDHATEFLRR